MNVKTLVKNPWVTAVTLFVAHWVYHWGLMAYMPSGLFGIGVVMSVGLLLGLTYLGWNWVGKS